MLLLLPSVWFSIPCVWYAAASGPAISMAFAVIASCAACAAILVSSSPRLWKSCKALFLACMITGLFADRSLRIRPSIVSTAGLISLVSPVNFSASTTGSPKVGDVVVGVKGRGIIVGVKGRGIIVGVKGRGIIVGFH